MPRLLLAFDFDYTMVDEDSDVFVFQHLAPDLLTKMRVLYNTGHYVWTDLMDLLLGDLSKRDDGYISEVITNTGHFDSNGRLRVQRWTTLPPHECNRCAANLCKGKEILKLIQNRGPFDRVVYLGDGQNDFCPSTKLNGSDWFSHALVAHLRKCSKILQQNHLYRPRLFLGDC
ncbi:hypothetical protein BASA83_005694 [Batrachochytrium salamandrivorans]|nr:hypothetical protein BASA83_005694 [Batrachochytrium salamandrivorans]